MEATIRNCTNYQPVPSTEYGLLALAPLSILGRVGWVWIGLLFIPLNDLLLYIRINLQVPAPALPDGGSRSLPRLFAG